MCISRKVKHLLWRQSVPSGLEVEEGCKPPGTKHRGVASKLQCLIVRTVQSFFVPCLELRVILDLLTVCQRRRE
ncbi:hypothetical protein CDAR_563181 [Caerostris darwini]|uniref:Uncharacterized protein n=1 Tax=Caerostris darwini TaxID=1538125 RepID=A0AAV4UVR5_9ARAC|nr:hypothetical protein CDAR_563181 [Caerostris darwini]